MYKFENVVNISFRHPNVFQNKIFPNQKLKFNVSERNFLGSPDCNDRLYDFFATYQDLTTDDVEKWAWTTDEDAGRSLQELLLYIFDLTENLPDFYRNSQRLVTVLSNFILDLAKREYRRVGMDLNFIFFISKSIGHCAEYFCLTTI